MTDKIEVTVAFRRGDRVEKISGSSWRGVVVGEYSTNLTPEGYAVESERELGSVQIYPAKALRIAAARPTNAAVEEAVDDLCREIDFSGGSADLSIEILIAAARAGGDVEALRAENARLREALEDIAEQPALNACEAAHVRADWARAALAKPDAGGAK